jgi:hypothetical protein
MAEPLRKSEEFAENSDKTREAAREYRGGAPTTNQSQGPERERETATLGEQIRARTDHPHKGDVGRPGTNEEVFQGSKVKELE